MGVKDTGVRIRVEKELRDEFLEICRSQDKPAAQVLREFMRDYVAEHRDDAERPRVKNPNTSVGKKR
jgi:Ribbon-helix-helix protein